MRLRGAWLYVQVCNLALSSYEVEAIEPTQQLKSLRKEMTAQQQQVDVFGGTDTQVGLRVRL